MAIKTNKTSTEIRLPVIKGKVLGVDVLRGYASLADLARVSRADIYDQKLNPTGTQRDLSPKHSRDAYQYVATHDFAFWPEVFLCVRDQSVIEINNLSKDKSFCELIIYLDTIRTRKSISISRVDGNHRLHFADGSSEGFPPLDKTVSFCLAYDLSLEQEIRLFRDINNNQRRMNTSHLDKIETRLTEEERLKASNPGLYIAQRLGKDEKSPFCGRVYEGGRRNVQAFVPLRSLKSGIGYMLSQSRRLTALPDTEAQYRVIRNYFLAIKDWEPEAWQSPKQFLMLRGAGLWGVCFVGAEVVDRALGNGKFSKGALLRILGTGPRWDWSNSGDFQGLSGRGGAVKIRDRIVSELQDEEGVSIRSLFQEIMKN